MSLLPVEEALERLLAGAVPVPEREIVGLREARGRVLAADLPALRTQPDFDASAMDGYALRAADVANAGSGLEIIGEAAAGQTFGGVVGRGEAVRIFTGAPVPDGADAVLIQENAERAPDGRMIRATESVAAGDNIRRRGNDFAHGQILLSGGRLLTAGAVALAASGNHPRLDVVRRPRVAILATGDELVLPGETVGPSQIVASNGFGVAAIVEAAGGEVLDYGIVPDEEAAIGFWLDRAVTERADILVTIGGASVGDHDLMGRVFEAHGVALDFWKVAMRPGKPIMAGRLGAMRLIGLPGNPASSMVAATLFLRPLIRRLAGRADRGDWLAGILGADVLANDHRAEFMRSRLVTTAGGPPELMPLGRQDSSLLSIHASADALLFRPVHAPAAHRGEPCRYLLLD